MTEMTTVEILRAARALISDPSRWTQEVAARDARGTQCNTDSPDAVRWCAHGALQRVESDAGGGEAVEVAGLRAAIRAETAAARDGGLPLTEVNDRHGHAAVLAVFDRAIEDAAAAAS